MKNTINIGSKVIRLDQPVVMGILNVTPDSFYKDSRFNPKEEEFLKKAEAMVEAGAGILDIGGYSTRPGGTPVREQEELDRVIPALEVLHSRFPDIALSIDTFRAGVAREALRNGARLINDISGGDFDPEMFPLVLAENPVYILMHQMGTDLTNMHAPHPYTNIGLEVADHLFKKANFLRSKGVKDVLIDPGFGFSKSLADNYALLENLQFLQNPHFPILVGMSRKSMVYKLLNIGPENSLPYSLHLHAVAVQKGAKILRVHDVDETVKMLQVIKELHYF
jgi:dihydropteroate synthase